MLASRAVMLASGKCFPPVAAFIKPELALSVFLAAYAGNNSASDATIIVEKNNARFMAISILDLNRCVYPPPTFARYGPIVRCPRSFSLMFCKPPWLPNCNLQRAFCPVNQLTRHRKPANAVHRRNKGRAATAWPIEGWDRVGVIMIRTKGSILNS